VAPLALWVVRALLASPLLAGCSFLTEPPPPVPVAMVETPAAPEAGAPSATAAPTASAAPTATAPPGPEAPMASTVLTKGKGAGAKTGDRVSVHYVGTFQDGKKFDSSRDHNKPFDFQLGAGRVIKGWDQGVVGMKVGGKRHLVIPQALGYADAGSPPNIPPRAGLKFEIELLEVNPKDASAAPPTPAAPPPDMDFDPEMEPDPENAEGR
jgi:peptidylprolyl isomerase